MEASLHACPGELLLSLARVPHRERGGDLEELAGLCDFQVRPMLPKATDLFLKLQRGKPIPPDITEDKGDVAGQAALVPFLQREKAAEKGHRRLDTQEAFAVEGEDSKEEIGVKAKVKGLDPVVFQDIHEEGRKGGNQAGYDGAAKNG